MLKPTAFVLLTLAALADAPAGAFAAECPRRDALGTARILAVDPAATPRVGLKNFAQTLPLADKEIVLTFDDGPAATTPAVLRALAEQCVRATFFLVGRAAAERPALVRRIAADGHTIGHHTWSHRNLAAMRDADTDGEIDRGVAAVESVLTSAANRTPGTPFFRFPYFAATPAILDRLAARRIAVFGADLWASDWETMTPEQQLQVLTSRLHAARKGIILLHDPRAQTVQMLPAFLRYLRDNGYRVVHIVPARPHQSASATSAPGARRD